MYRQPKLFWLLSLTLVALLSFVSLAYAQYDFNGETVKISIWRGFTGVTPLGDVNQFNWNDPDSRLQAHIEAVEEMFNCKIEFVPHVQSERNIVEFMGPEVITGIPNFDLIHVRNHDLFQLSALKLIHPLNDLVSPEYYASLPMFSRSDAGFKVADTVYAFEPMNNYVEPVMVLYNKDLFEEQGLPDLYELYENGEWTWDAMRQIAIETTRDTDGDGEVDQWGLNFMWRTFSSEYAGVLMSTNNANFSEFRDGKWVVTINEPAAVETMEFVQKLFYEDRVVYPSGSGDILNGKVAMLIAIPRVLAYAQIAPYNYGAVPLPKGPRATEHVAPVWNRWGFAIPITHKNPEALFELANALWMLTEPYMETDLETYEKNWWDRNALYHPDRTSMENSVWAYQNMVINPHVEFFGKYGDLESAINTIIQTGASPGAILDSIAPSLQALLDDLYMGREGSFAIPEPITFTVPGKIEAEDWRRMFGVDKEATSDEGGGMNVGWTNPGDWMEYLVDIKEAGKYRVDFRIASRDGGGQLELRDPQGNALLVIDVPQTGGWQNWETITGEVELTTDMETLTIFINQSGWNINWFEFTKID